MAALLDGAGDHFAQLVLRQPFGEWIERQQAHFGLVVLTVEPSDTWVGHFPAATAVPRFGREEHMLSLAELFAHEGLVEPRGAEIVVALAHEHANASFAEAATGAVDLDDL